MSETWGWRPHVTAEKFDAETVRRLTDELGHEPTAVDLAAVEPYEVIEHDGNLVTTLGSARIANVITGGGQQALTATRTVVGVGNSSAAVAAGQTDLQAAAGATNRWLQPCDAGFPSVTGNVITVKSTFASGDGNFNWAEFCWAIAAGAPSASSVFTTATASGIMLNRALTPTLGTKPLGEIWIHNATLTGP